MIDHLVALSYPVIKLIKHTDEVCPRHVPMRMIHPRAPELNEAPVERCVSVARRPGITADGWRGRVPLSCQARRITRPLYPWCGPTHAHACLRMHCQAHACMPTRSHKRLCLMSRCDDRKRPWEQAGRAHQGTRCEGAAHAPATAHLVKAGV